MSDFASSRWSDSAFAQEYRSDAEDYIPDRQRQLRIIGSFYQQFVWRPAHSCRVLDLGTGDGVVAESLLRLDPQIEATLLDGSADMLAVARKRLEPLYNVKLIEAPFEDLEDQEPSPATFDMVVSSLAIHHLTYPEKCRLFTRIHTWLTAGGYLLVADAVLGATDRVEAWYLALWRQWIEQIKDDGRRKALSSIPQRYKANSDNKPDTLLDQLCALQNAGFVNVDCYYKYGIFAMFGGRKTLL